MSQTVNQEYYDKQAQFYAARNCVNSRGEIIASPSYLPEYKNMSEDQILYQIIKQKREVPRKINESLSLSSISQIRNNDSMRIRGPLDTTNKDDSRQIKGKLDISDSTDLQELRNNLSRRPDPVNSDLYANKTESKTGANDRADSSSASTRQTEVNSRTSVKEQQDDPVPKEESKQKLSLHEKLNAKKKKDAPAVQEPKEIAPNPEREEPKDIKLRDEPETTAPAKKSDILSLLKRGKAAKAGSQQEETKPKSGPKSVSDMSLDDNDSNSVQSSDKAAQAYNEEQVPLTRQISGEKESVVKQTATVSETGTPKLRESPQEKMPKSQVETRSSHGNMREEVEDYKQRREEPRAVGLSQPIRNEEERNKMGYSMLKTNSTDAQNLPDEEGEDFSFGVHRRNESRLKRAEENSVPDNSSSRTLPQSKQNKEQDLLKRREEDIFSSERIERNINSRQDSLRQSQVSTGSRQNEKEYYEETEEVQPLINKAGPQLNMQSMKEVTRSSVSRDSEKGSPNRGKEYPYQEEPRMVRSQYINMESEQRNKEIKDAKEVAEREYLAVPQERFSEKPAKSETSLTESTEKRENDRGDKRSMFSMLKNIEEMLAKVLAKQDKMEEQQRKILEVQRRQEKAIEELRESMIE